MIISVRLNKDSDRDLILLSNHPDFKKTKTIKACLRSAANGKIYKFDIPRDFSKVSGNKDYFKIRLSNNDDGDIINFLKNFNGSKSGLIRILLRAGMDSVLVFPFSTNESSLEYPIIKKDSVEPKQSAKTENQEPSESSRDSSSGENTYSNDSKEERQPGKKDVPNAEKGGHRLNLGLEEIYPDIYKKKPSPNLSAEDNEKVKQMTKNLLKQVGEY